MTFLRTEDTTSDTILSSEPLSQQTQIEADQSQLKSTLKEETIKSESMFQQVNGGNSSDSIQRLLLLPTSRMVEHLVSGDLMTETTDKYSWRREPTQGTSNGRFSTWMNLISG